MVQIVKPSAQLEWITPEAELVIERATRKCYQSSHKMECASPVCGNGLNPNLKPDALVCSPCQECDARAGKFIRMLLKRGHDAPLGHAVASFTFVTDRGITHELVRHRLADYCQESTRYCNYGKGRFGQEITVILPPGMSDFLDPDGPSETFEERKAAFFGHEAWSAAMDAAEKHYLSLLKLGFKPQIARSVLPTCLKTEITMTCNLRQWRHVIALRSELNKAAHPQIREIIEQARKVLKECCPNVFHDR